MRELLHLEIQDTAKKFAEKMAVELAKILTDPILSMEASLYGSKLSEVGK